MGKDNDMLFEAVRLSDEAEELQIYIDNSRQLYNSRYIPILKNLSRKMKKGQYRRDLAAKGFSYLVVDGAKGYAKDHLDRGTKWNNFFSKKDRDDLAMYYAEQFEIQYKNKEFDFMDHVEPQMDGKLQERIESILSLFEKEKSDVVEALRGIVKSKAYAKIKLADGTSMPVDLFSASCMMNVHDNLNKQNQKKFADMVNSKVGFMKVHGLAMKHS